MRKLNARQLAREKSLFRYSSALERADFDTVAAVLQEAERDPLLAQMITEINMVYESETFRLSPSLNHSSNHREKELLMTTIVIPQRQRTMQRWLPITLAAACVSVLFIGALLMRPIRPGNFQAGMQVSSTATPTAAASPTLVPTEPFMPTLIPSAEVIGVSPVPPTVVPPPDVQAANAIVGTPVCGGLKIITQDSVVYVRPSNNSTGVGYIKAGTKAETMAAGFAAEDDTSNPQSQWFFIKADVDGNSVQGWVSATIAQPLGPANPCPSVDTVPSTGVIAPALVPADVQPAFAVMGTPVCSGAIRLDGTNMLVINQLGKPATIYAAPLTINSNAAVVGILPAKSEAVLLYQQYDQQSDPMAALWYLIMTNEKSEKQVTGWVSANSVTSEGSCIAEVSGVSVAPVPVSPGQLSTIPVPGIVSITQPGMCRVSNNTDKAATMFAAPLTSDSNAIVVGEFPAKTDALVIMQSYDRQSAPIGALWYLITINGAKEIQVTGWVSANSIHSPDTCAPEVVTVDAFATVVPQESSSWAATSSSTSAVAASSDICHVTNQQNESVPVFSGPSRDGNESTYVNNLPPNTPTAVLYQQRNKQTGEVWYLILAVMEQDKQISGWVSSDTVKMVDTCPPLP